VPAGARFLFESFELDPARRRLTSGGEMVALSERQLEILLVLVARAGQIVPKDDLLEAAWKEVAVGDNSLEQAISGLRRVLGASLIETVPRRGYRFRGEVAHKAARETDAGLDALLAPHRAFIEGRAALESLDRDQVARARGVFEETLKTIPDHSSAHVGLANACVMQFEMTRTDRAPDAAALAAAVDHAREACRLDSYSGEAWATLGFVLDRTGDRQDALAAAKRAVTLEPESWRHQFRLAFVGWGEERLRAAHRTLSLLPDFPLARWLAATVYVARQVLDEAERELIAGLATAPGRSPGDTQFSPVALHWLLGLIHLARGDERRALEEFERELALDSAGHLYGRECCANTWYAIGSLRLRQQRAAEAGAAFERALQHVAIHPMARVGLSAVSGGGPSAPGNGLSLPTSIETALVNAARAVMTGSHHEAATLVDDALSAAPPGNAAWLLPVEPLLQATAHPEVWRSTLARLRHRAA
jgi:DNA-binding winged helix-turn-helix (wHTH) protein